MHYNFKLGIEETGSKESIKYKEIKNYFLVIQCFLLER